MQNNLQVVASFEWLSLNRTCGWLVLTSQTDVAVRLRVCLETLGVEEAWLDGVPAHLCLPVAVTCYWLMTASPEPNPTHLKALLMVMVQGELNRRNGLITGSTCGHSLTHSPTPSLSHSLPHTLTPSLTPSLTHSLSPSHTHSVTHSLPHSLSPSHTHSLTPSLPLSLTHSLPHSLPPSLPLSLTHSLPHSLPPSLTLSLTHSLPHLLSPSLTLWV